MPDLTPSAAGHREVSRRWPASRERDFQRQAERGGEWGQGPGAVFPTCNNQYGLASAH